MTYLFVVKFDMNKGYTLVHLSSKNATSNDDTKVTADQIEYRAIPSGLHFCESDTIRFLQSVKTVNKVIGAESSDSNDNNEHVKTMKAIAFFQQNGFKLEHDDNDKVDRSKIKMYSVGILHDYNENINDNSELVQDIKFQLNEFINLEAGSMDENEQQFIDKLTTIFDKDHSNNGDNFEQVNKTIRHFGPFIYRIWRALLTGKRVLLKNEVQKNHAVNDNDNDDFHGPIDINTSLIEFLENSCNGISNNTLHVKFLYNLTLHDISKFKLDKSSFIASTSEELIISQWNMVKFDYLVTFSNSRGVIKLEKVNSNNNGVVSQEDVRLHEVKFTARDMLEFCSIMAISDDAAVTNYWKNAVDNSWLALINSFIYGNLRNEDDDNMHNAMAVGTNELVSCSSSDSQRQEDLEDPKNRSCLKNIKSKLSSSPPSPSIFNNNIDYQFNKLLLKYLNVLNLENDKIQSLERIPFATTAQMGLAPLTYDDYEFCVNFYNSWISNRDINDQAIINIDGKNGGESWLGSLLKLVWY